jgi:hypothetical protein
MGFLSSDSMDVSPIQHHQVQVCTEIFWAEGELESLGDPHRYINQDDLDFLQLNEPRITPWPYTSLPASEPSEVLANRNNIYMLHFPSKETNDMYRPAPKLLDVVIYYPLFIVQAKIPLFSEAKLENFLEFWKGIFIPASQASIHYLVGGPSNRPSQSPLVYVNRKHIQGYVGR